MRSSLKVTWRNDSSGTNAGSRPGPEIDWDDDGSSTTHLPLRPNPQDPVTVIPVLGYGDMFKSQYDTNNNGVVDSADSIELNNVIGLRDELDAMDSSATTLIANRALSGHRIVKDIGSGKMDYADSTVENDAFLVVGMITSAYAMNAVGVVLSTGLVVEPSWSWTVGAPVFLTTNGMLTQTPPAAPDAFSMQVATAVSTTSVRLNIERPIFL